MMNRFFLEEEKKLVANFLRNLDKEVIPLLQDKRTLFPSSDKLLAEFAAQRPEWEEMGLKYISEINALANKISIAFMFLSSPDPGCSLLEYKPVLEGTDQQMDFYARMDNGIRLFCDVKSIRFNSFGAWENSAVMEKIMEGFPPERRTVLLASEQTSEIRHKWSGFRKHMLDFTTTLEDKINTCHRENRTFFVLIFCSNGYDWESGHLQDFTHFYRTGDHNPDDAFSQLEDLYISNRGIKLRKSIHEFAYLERKPLEIKPKRIISRLISSQRTHPAASQH